MAMDVGDWTDFMPDTVTIAPWKSYTVSGASVYDTTATKKYPARIEMRNHRVVDKLGREITARGRVFLGTTDIPDVRDLLTLPDRYQPTEPPILDVNSQPDEDGVHHVTLEIG